MKACSADEELQQQEQEEARPAEKDRHQLSVQQLDLDTSDKPRNSNALQKICLPSTFGLRAF